MRKKKGTIQAYFHLSIQSSLVCNGKMNFEKRYSHKNLKGYRPIEKYVFKKKTNKQNKTKKQNKKQKQKN